MLAGLPDYVEIEQEDTDIFSLVELSSKKVSVKDSTTFKECNNGRSNNVIS